MSIILDLDRLGRILTEQDYTFEGANDLDLIVSNDSFKALVNEVSALSKAVVEGSSFYIEATHLTWNVNGWHFRIWPASGLRTEFGQRGD